MTSRITRREVPKAGGLAASAPVMPCFRRVAAHDNEKSKSVAITIYNTGDLHDHSGTLARIAGFIKAKKQKQPNTLFVDAGDIMNRGEPQMEATRGEGMIHLVSKCGYDRRVPFG